MAVYTKRVQTVLTVEQYKKLSDLAEKKEQPISVLVRDAIDEVYFQQIKQQQRREALKRLLALGAPVTDWEQTESEIIQGANE
ncbi:MAG: hypothetical protein ISS57_10275 [Anaerolineales bacterium]|nr:hypothetical protein [Anaerolineales bacterium]